MEDEDVRVLNGIRRGEDFAPILIRSVGNLPKELSGFDVCSSTDTDLLAGLTPKQREHWSKLPHSFRFEDVADELVPRASLHRLLLRAKSVSIVLESDGCWLRLLV